MHLKHWLLFSVALAAVVVGYLGVVQLSQFNSYFHIKPLGSSSSYSQSEFGVVPLSGDRFAVIEGHNIKVYGVDALGRLSLKDGIDTTSDYAERTNEIRRFQTIEPQPKTPAPQ